MALSNDLITALLDTSDRLAAILDSSGTVIRPNRALSELLRHNQPQLVGLPAAEVLAVKAERDGFQRWLLSVEAEAAESSRQWASPAQSIANSITWSRQAIGGLPGNKAGLLLTGRVSAAGDAGTAVEKQLRESKDFLQTVLDGLPAHVAVLDDAGLIIMVNEAWRRFARENGLSDSASGVGQNYLQICHQACGLSTEGAREAAEGIQRVIVGRQKGFFLEYPCHSPDEQRWFELRVTPYTYRERLGAIVAHVNISERRRAERDRSLLEAQLHHTQKLEAIGQLSAGIAHDFNNLLTAILGHVELARHRASLDTDMESTLSFIEQAARQAAGVTRSLLTFSRKLPVDRQRNDLREVLTEASRLLRRTLPGTIRFDIEYDDEEPIVSVVDPNQIQHVLVNLGINARDAMGDSGTLTIRLEKVARSEPAAKLSLSETELEAATYAKVSVQDTGMGMSEEVRARIFEPFYTTKERTHGAGLGLAVIHGIVGDHDGHIAVDSEPDQGTIVSIYLPCVNGGPPGEADCARLPARGRGERILLAEDNRFVRETTAMILQSMGFEVLQVEDGEALLETMTKLGDRIELIVVDVDLPKRNGADCLKELRRRGHTKPAIGITGSGMAEVNTEGLGDFVLLRKPFQVDQIASLAIERLTAAQRGERP